MPQLDLPEVPTTALQREFFVDDARLEVTSMDIPSHGAFILAGCSNGMVLLFDLTESSPQRNGILLAQIRARGMHTNLRLTIKISEDSRMCFVGVMKGSSELIAIDMSSYLVDWSAAGANAAAANRGKKPSVPTTTVTSGGEFLNYYHFENFTHSDAKLRGFGASTCWNVEDANTAAPVSCSTPSSSVAASSPPAVRKYLLACGMGIKNVHVWQLTIRETDPTTTTSSTALTTSESENDDEGEGDKRDEWSCIYDMASNGMTITHLAFRHGGREMLTKSNGMNLRVWDLSKPAGKPLFEDVPNSHDVKCLLDNSAFAFGGTYEFAMVKVDKHTPKDANRNVFELMERPFQEKDEAALAAGLRRRRTMREVQDVISTQDGVHVLVLCADGGVMYYCRAAASPTANASDAAVHSNRKSSEQEDDNEDELGVMQELSCVQRVSEEDQAWAVKRIGSSGQVVLLRAAQRGGAGKIAVSLLSRVLKRDPSLAVPFSEGSTQWHPSGQFYQSRVLPSNSLPAPVSAPVAVAIAEKVKPAVVVEKETEKVISPEKEKEKETKKSEKETPEKSEKDAEDKTKKMKKPMMPSTPSSHDTGSKEPKPSPCSVNALSTPLVTAAKKPPRMEPVSKAAVGERPPRPVSVREKEKEKESSGTPRSETPLRERQQQLGLASCPSTPTSRNLFRESDAKSTKSTPSSSSSSAGIAAKALHVAEKTPLTMKVVVAEKIVAPTFVENVENVLDSTAAQMDTSSGVRLGRVPSAKRTLFPAELSFAKRPFVSLSSSQEQHKTMCDTLAALLKNYQRTVSEHCFAEEIVTGALSPSLLLAVGCMLRDQIRVHNLFLAEVAHAVSQHSEALASFALDLRSKEESEEQLRAICQKKLVFLSAISNKFRAVTAELLLRQNMEFQAMVAKEDIELMANLFVSSGGKRSLVYRYQAAFAMTERLRGEVVQVLMSK